MVSIFQLSLIIWPPVYASMENIVYFELHTVNPVICVIWGLFYHVMFGRVSHAAACSSGSFLSVAVEYSTNSSVWLRVVIKQPANSRWGKSPQWSPEPSHLRVPGLPKVKSFSFPEPGWPSDLPCRTREE